MKKTYSEASDCGSIPGDTGEAILSRAFNCTSRKKSSTSVLELGGGFVDVHLKLKYPT